ncbi:MAG TPA: glycosyltransferase family A protein [Pyrinomonadaceae bacterium]|jgi:glycosyltransferase involved in cell wall biosynthesis
MSDLSVSVIVPVYNGERFLARALESIFAQQLQPSEVIVVDDGSTDNTSRVARSFVGVRYAYQRNQGSGAACNTALARARGEVIAFLDSDDLWTPDKLRVQVGYMSSRPQVGYTLARMRNFLEPGVEMPPWLDERALREDQVCYGPGTLVARRAVFDQIGVFDPRYKLASDFEWLARANAAGVPTAVLPETLLHRRVHDSNQSYNMAAIRNERFMMLKTAIRNGPGRPSKDDPRPNT